MKGFGNNKDLFMTSSGIPIKSVYTPQDFAEVGFEYHSFLGLPGSYPFTRGISPQMYRGDLWIMGQYSGYGSAEETNKRLKYLIEKGQTGFSLALDLPTQLGLDSDDVNAESEVGKVGVPIDTLKDLEIIFNDISLGSIRQIRTTANAISPIALSLFISLFEGRGINPNSVKILIQNDILKEYISRGTYIFPIDASIKICVDVIEYCTKYLPNWNPISICGYHIREAGSTAVQEIAFTLGNAKVYIEESLKRGLKPDDFLPNLFFMLSANMNLFEEVAKFRAMRRLWAKIVKNEYKATDPESMKLKIFAFTGGSTLTMQEPFNNIVRVTIEALASVFGGVQVLHTSSYDEALGLPTETAVELALRTQQIIGHETGVTDTADPLGGSYFVETLTANIEREIEKCLKTIESQGGVVEGLKKGFLKKALEDSAYRQQRMMETGQKIIVGLNKYSTNEQPRYQPLRVDEESKIRQIERLKAIKRGRKSQRVRDTLGKLKNAAKNNENLVPPILDAVKNYATVGEICRTLKEVYGEYKEAV
jgi:methylmalonyl-CoA mutase N-terminal domain/subunit